MMREWRWHLIKETLASPLLSVPWDTLGADCYYFQSVKASQAEGLHWGTHYPHEKDGYEVQVSTLQSREAFLREGPPLPMLLPEVVLGELVSHLGALDAPWWRAHSLAGEEMLARAAENNEEVRGLLAAGVDVNYRDIKGRTALYFALRSSAQSLVLFLLERGANIHLRYPGYGDEVRPLLEREITALHLANGDHEIMKRLIMLGADVNAKQINWPHGALQQVRFWLKDAAEVIQLAISAGLDLVAYGPGLVVDALRASNREAAELLLAAGVDGARGSILCSAVRYPDLVKRLLALGADVNANDPLISAIIAQAPIETLTLLLEAGAKINAANSDGGTPLHWAARMGSLEVLTLLLRAGANINAQDKLYVTPVIAALVGRKFEAALFLLEHGADAKIKAGSLGINYFLSKERPKEVSLELWERLLKFRVA